MSSPALNRARDAILACQGYGLADLSFSVIGRADTLHIGFRWGPKRPDLTLSMRSVHYFALHRLPNDDVPFFDFEAMVVQPDQPWPDGLPTSITTSGGLPALLWVHGDGPATFDVVAAIATVLSETNP